jgi:hypothetical protein
VASCTVAFLQADKAKALHNNRPVSVRNVRWLKYMETFL